MPEVHVGDVGTRYSVRIRNAGLPFDPTSATAASLVFRLPGVEELVTLSATITHPDGDWFLVYAHATPGFHFAEGLVRVQAILTFQNGDTYHTDIRQTDDAGDELRIYPNLL